MSLCTTRDHERGRKETKAAPPPGRGTRPGGEEVNDGSDAPQDAQARPQKAKRTETLAESDSYSREAVLALRS